MKKLEDLRGKANYKYDEKLHPKLANEYLQEKLKENHMPSAAGLAVKLEVNKNTLYEWAKNHPSIEEIMGRIKVVAEMMLQEQSLYIKTTNVVASIFLLKANHGYKETTTVENTGNQTINITRQIIDGTENPNPEVPISSSL